MPRLLATCASALVLLALARRPARAAEIDHLPRYGAVRADVAPTVDGVLDDPIWQRAPKDDRFFSMRSKPYGERTRQPTAVQVAYDETNLYVAFTCAYGAPGPRDDAMPPDENTLFDLTERVGVLVDPRDDHTNAKSFTVGRAGARGDSEVTNNGGVSNRDWHGLWDAATARQPNDTWTAEIAIPWGTLGMPAREEKFQVGIEFLRVEPTSQEYSAWSPAPPAILIAPSFFGHLDGLADIHPSQRLFLQPYVATVVRGDAGDALPRLRDFTGSNGTVGVYAGGYARYRPPGALAVDATFNPDFSTVTPDRALTNLDRFELSYPEVRPFFAEDRPRFEMGSANAQLFYSRRVGLRTTATGAYQEVPVLWGGKAVVREEGTQVAAMNVGLAATRVATTDQITAVRFNQSFEHGRRVGTLALVRSGDAATYLATGVDGAYTMFDEHLALTGFYARSATRGEGSGGMGQADIAWGSEEFNARLTYTDVGDTFDAQLGFVPITGARSTALTAFYTPVLHTDLVRQVALGAQLDRTKSQGDALVYDRGYAEATAFMQDGSIFSARVLPSLEGVAQPFGLFANRIAVPAGRYDVMVVQLQASTPPRRVLEGAFTYTEGDLFGGYRRNPGLGLTLNLDRLAASTQYQVYFVRYGDLRLTGHQLSARATYSYTPLARTALAIEANTLTLRSVVQLVTSWQFGALSTVSFVLGESSGLTPARPELTSWYDRPIFAATLNFALGVSPF